MTKLKRIEVRIEKFEGKYELPYDVDVWVKYEGGYSSFNESFKNEKEAKDYAIKVIQKGDRP